MVELLETGSPPGLSMQLSEEPMGPTLIVPFPLGSTKAARHHEQRGQTTLHLLLYMGKRQSLSKELLV